MNFLRGAWAFFFKVSDSGWEDLCVDDEGFRSWHEFSKGGLASSLILVIVGVNDLCVED